MDVRKKGNRNEKHNYLCHNNLTDGDVFPHLKAHVAAFKKLNKKRLGRGYQKYNNYLHPPISNELASLIMIITEKILNGPKFKYYSDEWRESMRYNAHLLLCKYLHNFKQRHGSCLSYVYNAAERAIIQSLNKHREADKRIIECSFDSIADTDYIQPEPEFNVNLI